MMRSGLDRAALAIWRLSLRLLPRPFRERYADDMTAAFHERRADAWDAGGGRAVVWLICRAVVDLARTGAAERWRSSLDVNQLAPRRTPGDVHRPVGGLMTGLWQDARFALRLLRRQPVYTFFVTLTLVVGLGANTAVFSVVDGVLLRPLPFSEPDRLVAVWGRFLPESGFDFPQFVLSGPELIDYRDENRSLDAVAGYFQTTLTVGGPEADPERVRAIAATPNLFSTLGVVPARGRVFEDADSRPGAPSVVVLSHGFWQTRFAGAADIVGRTVPLSGETAAIIGVMPPSFDYPAGARMWMPLTMDPANPGNRQSHGLNAIGRLANGVTLEQAQAEMATLMAGWKARFPDIHTGHFLYLSSLLDDTVGGVRPVLAVLFAATSLLLLIVCANVGSLVLARGETRGREMAIRTALGAARRRLIRLTLVESAILAAIGGAGGVLLAIGAVRWLGSLDNVGIPRVAEVSVDWRVMGFATAVAVLAAAVFAVIPVWRGASAGVQSILRDDARTSTSGRGRARAALVGGQVALVVVLVIGAGLMIRSLAALTAVQPGFDPDGVLLASLSLPSANYQEDARVEAFYEEVLARTRALPGVTSAGAASTVPIVRGMGVWDFEVEALPEPGPGQPAWNAPPGAATPGVFEALRVPLVAGRWFTAEDTATSMPVAVVTQAFERKFLAGETALDRRIRISSTREWMTIVGVVGDMRDQSLDVEARPMYFFAHSQLPRVTGGPGRGMAIVARVDGDPSEVASSLRAIVRDLDPRLPLYNVQSYAEALAASTARQRFASTLFGIFASIGLVLGAIGVYGVLAYSVAERTREIGIRRALGAPGGRLVRGVLLRGMTPVASGIVVGLGLAWAGSGYLESELFGITATDRWTYAGVSLMVCLVALAACLAPVRRALSVDPSTALRG
jgi:putative ABC transport system permease protein